MEQADDFSRRRIYRRDVRPFLQVAAQAAEAQVGLVHLNLGAGWR
jgi:hypothetical protein